MVSNGVLDDAVAAVQDVSAQTALDRQSERPKAVVPQRRSTRFQHPTTRRVILRVPSNGRTGYLRSKSTVRPHQQATRPSKPRFDGHRDSKFCCDRPILGELDNPIEHRGKRLHHGGLMDLRRKMEQPDCILLLNQLE